MQFQKLYFVPLRRVYEYSLLDESLEDPRQFREKRKPFLFTYYNPQGNIVKKIEFSDGRQSVVTTNEYVGGKLTVSRVEYPDAGGSEQTRYVYLGNEVEIFEEMDGYVQSHILRILDDSGRLREQIEFGKGDSIFCKQTFNEHEDLVRLEYPGESVQEYEYEYNKEGRLLCSREFSTGHDLLNETRFSYVLGMLREEVRRDGEGHLTRREYAYGAGDKLKRVLILNEHDGTRQEHEFNARGEIVKQVVYSGEEVLDHWERQDFPEKRGELYLEKGSVEQEYRYQGTLVSTMTIDISGKREILRDREGREQEILISNYRNREDGAPFMEDGYYFYEYGEE